MLLGIQLFSKLENIFLMHFKYITLIVLGAVEIFFSFFDDLFSFFAGDYVFVVNGFFVHRKIKIYSIILFISLIFLLIGSFLFFIFGCTIGNCCFWRHRKGNIRLLQIFFYF
jgi:hypothetical protein